MVNQSLLQQAKEACALLDAESDNLNEVFVALEEELEGIGLCVDLRIRTLLGQAVAREVVDEGTYSEREVDVQRGYIPCYAKCGREWGICVRSAEYVAPSGTDQWEFRKTGEYIPILNAPRVVRVEATEYLDQLVSALTGRAEELIETVREANARAQK